MKVTFLKSISLAVVVLSLSFLIGCAGFEYAPKKNYLVYHKELPQAERAVEDAALAGKNKQCPDEFNEAKALMEKAYETYWACRTQEAIAMAKEARGKALALCPPPPTCELTAAPKDIELEQSSTLTMKTAGKVKTALLDGTTVAPTGGTKNVTPPNTMPYLAHVAGPGGSGTCSATVTVTIPPAPSCELTAAPKEIEQGQSSTLTLKTGGKVKSAVLDGTSLAPTGGTKTVSPADTTSYIAQCSGPGGSTVSSATVTVTPPPPPTCELTAAPKEIEQGQSSTLTLKTGGKVKSATIDGTAVSPSGGTKTINPASSSVYIAQCIGQGGSVVSSAAVTVLPPPPPTAELTAAPKEIEQGKSSTLTLKTGGKVKSATIDGTEVPAAGGTKIVSPANTTSYIAQASGPGGSALSSATVTVMPPPAPACELTAAPKEIEQGQSSTLTLKTGGKVKSAVLDGTEVPAAGGTKTVSPKNTSPYLAQCSGPGGTSTGSATITVTPPPAPTCELTANPKEITQGQSANLTLKTGGKVISAILDGTEVPAAGGTKTVSPKNTSPYLAQCSGPGGTSTGSATITVTPPPAPTCELTANPKEITQGQSANLTLKTGGKVISAILDGMDVPAAGGTKTVSPKNTSPYMAQVSGPGGSVMCSTTVSVTPPPPPPAPTVMDRMIIHINFDFNKSEIRNIDKAEMQRAINFARKYPVTQITVEGHTDNIDTEQYNQSLSERRAEAVKKYLVKEGGIDATKITTIGYGETKPVTSNDTAEGRAANRRAEILVISK